MRTSSGLNPQGLSRWAAISRSPKPPPPSPHFPGPSPHSRLCGGLCRGASLLPTQMGSGSRGARTASGCRSTRWPNRCSQDSWACHQLSHCPGNLHTSSAVSTTSPGATTGAAGREEGQCGRSVWASDPCRVSGVGRAEDTELGVIWGWMGLNPGYAL